MFKPYQRAELEFEVVREIGQDGQNSRTFITNDRQLNATIVTKQMSKAKLGDPTAFFDEAKALYASAHPHVVQVHYACFDNDNVYVAMPYYQKGSLKALMEGKRLTVREVITIACQVLSGLHNIHSKGLIHFDIKPDNILFSDRGEAMVSDFGLAKQMNLGGVAEPDRLYSKTIAPEAMSGDPQLGRTFDIYQFGLTLYRMCNGNRDFYAQYAAYSAAGTFDRATFAYDVRNERFPNRSRFGEHIPSRLRTVIKTCLKADPSCRFQSAIDAANALAVIDGHELDWRLVETPGMRSWSKNESGTEYVFNVDATGKTECFKTAASGQPRRVGDGCKATMTEREIRAFLGTY